jgi:nicotinamidase-related amidase
MAGRVAVLLVDVVNHFRFPGGRELLEAAHGIAPALRALRAAAHASGVPVIYANDNFGDWRSDSGQIVTRCSGGKTRAAAFVRKLAPTSRDYFVLKPANSAFYCTTLEPLLHALGAKTLVLCGLTADNCVLFTAHDAYLRGYRVRIPADCVASQRSADTKRALEQMRIALKADVRPSSALRFAR